MRGRGGPRSWPCVSEYLTTCALTGNFVRNRDVLGPKPGSPPLPEDPLAVSLSQGSVTEPGLAMSEDSGM